MPVLEWRETARTDLLAIIDYILDDNPGAAQRLKDDIEAGVEKLLERPTLYRAGRVEGTREMIVRSNYVVVYTENARAITILRVLHVAQQWPPFKSRTAKITNSKCAFGGRNHAHHQPAIRNQRSRNR